jgi:hypothetical protein
MPSQLPQDGAGNVYDVTANYLVTKPSTRFSTRQLAFFNVAVSNCHVNPYLSDSIFSRAVRAIQVNAEIHAVGVPAAGNFVVIVSQDTANDGDNTDDGLNAMAQTLSTVTGGTVTAVHLSGTGFTSGLMDYSDESQADTGFTA